MNQNNAQNQKQPYRMSVLKAIKKCRDENKDPNKVFNRSLLIHAITDRKHCPLPNFRVNNPTTQTMIDHIYNNSGTVGTIRLDKYFEDCVRPTAEWDQDKEKRKYTFKNKPNLRSNNKVTTPTSPPKMDYNFSNQVPNFIKNPLVGASSSDFSRNYGQSSDTFSRTQYEEGSYNNFKPNLTTIKENEQRHNTRSLTRKTKNPEEFFEQNNQNVNLTSFEESTKLNQGSNILSLNTNIQTNQTSQHNPHQQTQSHTINTVPQNQQTIPQNTNNPYRKTDDQKAKTPAKPTVANFFDDIPSEANAVGPYLKYAPMNTGINQNNQNIGWPNSLNTNYPLKQNPNNHNTNSQPTTPNPYQQQSHTLNSKNQSKQTKRKKTKEKDIWRCCD